MAVILDGKKLAQEVKSELKEEVKRIKEKIGRPPKLCVILVGNDKSSEIYVRNKEKSAKEVGIDSKVVKLEENITQEELNEVVKMLNNDESVDGVMIQLPLPKHLSCREALKFISPVKDVDGFHPENMGLCALGLYSKGLMPCTPFGVMKFFEKYNISLKGKNAVMVGHSNIVGKPLALMLLNADATVSVCHEFTKDLKDYTLMADILCVATGVPGLIKEDMVKEGVVVIDIGINWVNGKIVGDVDFDGVSKKSSAITPVPGGVGPMTVAMLLYNTVKAVKMRLGI
jgi:methylenetetrahydrofolate dehydrogenase (NADP+)/methenyltetrahydrofolate cyclohydrolase